jgi:hypothetical protein
MPPGEHTGQRVPDPGLARAQMASLRASKGVA